MNNPLLQPDPGLFIWTIITFLVLLTALAKFAWGPLLLALDARQQAIRKALDDAQQAKAELERIAQESAQIIRQADGRLLLEGETHHACVSPLSSRCLLGSLKNI